jgi:hypothetical protein
MMNDNYEHDKARMEYRFCELERKIDDIHKCVISHYAMQRFVLMVVIGILIGYLVWLWRAHQ